MPATIATTRPDCGANEVASTVTSAGPVTKTTSSATPSTANAVCRSPASSSRWAHRARTMVPTCGIAMPATTASRWGHGKDQPSVTATTIRLELSPKATVSTESTRVCPNRSVSRPWSTANPALPAMKAAVTWPARA